MMDTRVSLFERLSHLQGKLDLILSQVASQGTESEEEVTDSHAPLLAYQDGKVTIQFLTSNIKPHPCYKL